VRRRAVDRRAVDRRAVDRRAVDRRAVDHRAVDHRAVDHRAVDHRAVDHRRIAPSVEADRRVDRGGVGTAAAEGQRDRHDQRRLHAASTGTNSSQP
jgi:hypothetical protein